MLLGEDIAVGLRARGDQFFGDLPAQDLIRVAVAHDKDGALGKIRRGERRHMRGRFRADVDRTDADRVPMAAFALEIRLRQFLDRRMQNIQTHSKPSCFKVIDFRFFSNYSIK